MLLLGTYSRAGTLSNSHIDHPSMITRCACSTLFSIHLSSPVPSSLLPIDNCNRNRLRLKYWCVTIANCKLQLFDGYALGAFKQHQQQSICKTLAITMSKLTNYLNQSCLLANVSFSFTAAKMDPSPFPMRV